MRIAANLGPAGDWSAVLSAARTAEAHGYDAVSFLDHYHAAKLEWPYLCGWSLYGALAKETVEVLRRIWTGEFVTFEGEQLHLVNAASTPVPPTPPRIVVGAGSSRRLIRSAVEYADEINVYADDELVRFARQQIETSRRTVSLSVYVWDWPEDIAAALKRWEQLGVERTFLTFWPPFDTLVRATDLMA